MARHNRQILALLSDAMAAVASLDLESALRELVGAMVDAHRVDPELHRIFDEQVPRHGQLAEIETIKHETCAVVRAYLESRRSEIGVTDLDTATFICVTTVETLTHEIALRPPDSARIEATNFVDEVTRLLVGYLRPISAIA